MSVEPGSILICDSQPIAVEGLRALIERCEGLTFAGSVATLEAGFELLRALRPAAVVVDKSFGVSLLLEWLHQVAALGIETEPVIWGSTISESEALRLLQAGAKGVVRRTAQPETLIRCLTSVTSGMTWMEDGIFGDKERGMQPRRSQLTPREVEIVALVERGLRNRDIARTLGIQTGTVKIHLKHIFEKTGVRGRYGLALTGLREKGSLPTQGPTQVVPQPM